jgi:hypothetical protein
MIKYIVIPEKRAVVAVLKGTEMDAVYKIHKVMCDTPFWPTDYEKYLMPNEFKSVVYCDERDEFDIDKGKQLARERLMSRYYKSLDKRVDWFVLDVQKLVARTIKYTAID